MGYPPEGCIELEKFFTESELFLLRIFFYFTCLESTFEIEVILESLLESIPVCEEAWNPLLRHDRLIEDSSDILDKWNTLLLCGDEKNRFAFGAHLFKMIARFYKSFPCFCQIKNMDSLLYFVEIGGNLRIPLCPWVSEVAGASDEIFERWNGHREQWSNP